jgi:prophage antirepressor-like protein
MNSIQLYSNEDFSVRTVKDADGTVWFVAKDIMNALEYSETSTPAQVMQSVPSIWSGIKRIDSTSDKPTARPYQDVLCLTEQGVYFFLGRSDKPKALPYQMWIAA